MTPELLAVLVGGVLSVLLEYVPGLRAWWEGLRPDYKSFGIALLTIVVGLGVYGLSCSYPDFLANLGVHVTCDQTGLAEVLRAIVAVLVGSQVTYPLVKGVKKGRK